MFSGALAVLIGSSVLFMTFSNTEESLGLRMVGVLFLAAGIFGLLTGTMVKFSSRKKPDERNRSSRYSPNARTRRNFGDEVYVEINGAISRIPFRYPAVYNEYFYHIVNQMKQEKNEYVETAPPSYDQVVKDTDGVHFSFIPCNNDSLPPPYDIGRIV